MSSENLSCMKDFIETERKEWVTNKWPSQAILTVSQIYWTRRQEALLMEKGIAGFRISVK